MSLREHLARRLVSSSLRLSFKLPGRLPVPLTLLRAGMEQGSRPFRPHPDVQAESTRLADVPCLRLRPPHASARVLLHIHGGAFFGGSSASHHALGSELARRAEAEVWLADYRRAPEHAYPAAFDDARSCYEALLATGHRPEDIVLGGDSAGGALVLALCLWLRDHGQPQPGGLLMISPFLDMRLSNPSVRQLARRDPMLTVRPLQRGADAYRGAIASDDPCVSPGLAPSLAGLPPTLVQVGSEEILLDDAREFSARAIADGSPVRCQILPGLWHDAAMFHALIPSANAALDTLAAFVREPGHA